MLMDFILFSDIFIMGKPKQNHSSQDQKDKPQGKPKPNDVVLGMVTAGDISHMKMNKINELDKVLDEHIASVSQEKPKSVEKLKDTVNTRQSSDKVHTSVEQHKSSDVAAKKTDKENINTSQASEKASHKSNEKSVTQVDKGITQQVAQAKEMNQDNIVVSKPKIKKTHKPTNIPHEVSDSEPEQMDPRDYRWDPREAPDLSVPTFRVEDDTDSAYTSQYYAPPVYKRKSPSHLNESLPVRKRQKWPDESFYDPRTGTEYVPIYSQRSFAVPRQREYYYSRPRPAPQLYSTYPYSNGDHFLDEADDFEYDDENIEFMEEEPRVPPIPLQYLHDPSLDENLIRAAPKIHTPVATPAPQATSTPSQPSTSGEKDTSTQNDLPAPNRYAPPPLSEQNDLLQDYLLPDDSGTGPELPPRMVRFANEYWDQGICDYERLHVSDAYDRLQRPQNATNLVPTLVNPEIRMPKNSPITIKDRQLRALQHAVLKASYGTLAIMTKAYNTQTALDHKALIDLGVDTYRCLAYSNGRINKMRKHNVRPMIEPTLRSICDKIEDPPSHALLLGSDLKKNCQEATEVLKIQASTSKKKKQRGRGGYRFQRGFYNARYTGNYDIHSSQKSRGGRHIMIDDYNMSGHNPWYLDIGFQNDNSHVDDLYTIHDNSEKSGSAIHNDSKKSGSANVKKFVFDFSQETQGLVHSDPTRMVSKALPQRKAGTACQERQQLVSIPRHQVKQSDINLQQFSFLAGGVGTCINAWKLLSHDSSIINIVKGLTLDFIEKPAQSKLPHEIQFSEKEKILVQKEIDRLLDLGIITRSTVYPGDYVSNFFTRPKKDKDKIRCILNAKSINKYIRFKHFKMDNLQTALNIMRPGMYMGTLDIVDSYFAIPIRDSYKKYLKFITLGQCFQFEVMPQGFRDSAFIFTKLLKVPLAYLRQEFGFLSVAYVDDIILFGYDSQECLQNLKVTSDLLQKLGYGLNVPKSLIDPATERAFVGFVLNSIEMSVSLTLDRTQKIMKSLRAIRQKSIVKIRIFASMVGQLVATFPAVRYGPLHSKKLEISKTIALNRSRKNYEAKMTISEQDHAEIDWWIATIPGTKVFLIPRKIQYTFYTDASSTGGWGFHLVEQNLTVGQQWSPQEKTLHINVLETKSILFSILSCLKKVHHSAIMVYSDNTTAVQGLKSQGTTKSFACNKIMRKILRFCEEHDIHLNIAHVAGKNNQIADTASRKFKNIDTEWSLPQDTFENICKILGNPQIDLFASRLNRKMNKFCSWYPDPEATHVDAFSVDLSNYSYIYCFPPFSLISRVLNMLELHHNITMLLIAPVWQGQPWWPQMLRYLIAPPVLVPKHDRTLILPQCPEQLHKRRKTLRICALKLSANTIKLKVFQKKCQKSFNKSEWTRLNNNTVHTLRDGFNMPGRKGYVLWDQSLLK